MRVTIHALCLFFVDKVFGVKIQNLAGNLRGVIGRVKLRNFYDTVLAVPQAFKKFFLADTDRSNRPDSGNYNSIFHINAPFNLEFLRPPKLTDL